MERLEKKVQKLQWAAGICFLTAASACFLEIRLNYVIATATTMHLEGPGFQVSASTGKEAGIVYLYTDAGPSMLLSAFNHEAAVRIGADPGSTGMTLKVTKNGVASIVIPDLKGDSALVITNEYGKAAIVHKPLWQTK